MSRYDLCGALLSLRCCLGAGALLLGCAPRGHEVRELAAPALRELPAQPLSAATPPPLCGSGGPLRWQRPREGSRLAILPDGPVLVTGGKWLYVLARESGEPLATHDVGHSVLALQPLDSRRVLLVTDGPLLQLTIPGLDQRTVCDLPKDMHMASVSAGHVALATHFAAVHVVQRPGCAPVLSLAAHGPFVKSLVLSPDGARLAIDNGSGVIEVLTLAGAQRHRVPLGERDHGLRLLGFSQDARVLWLDDKTPRSYDWRSGKPTPAPPGEEPPQSEVRDQRRAADGLLRCQFDGARSEQVLCEARCP